MTLPIASRIILNKGKISKLLKSIVNWRFVCLISLVLVAMLIRIIIIQAPGVLVEREYGSAIIARAFYFDHNSDIEVGRQEIANKVKENYLTLEPPVNEFLVSLLYRIMGKEELWYSRFFTYSFWMVGGLFLYKLTKQIVSVELALAAVSYYLLVPSGIAISRSFQPDALMMMLFVISLYYIMQNFYKPSLKTLLLAAIISGLTILIRPLVVFPIICVFFFLSIYYSQTWKVLFNRHFLLFLLISLILPALYYGYGFFFADFLRDQVDMSFLPYLYMRKEFWKGWFLLLVNEVGLIALISALIGFWLMKKGPIKALSFGLVIGYLFFAVVFNYHISTHPYYHLQLLPLITICLIPTLDLVVNALKGAVNVFWWLPVAGITFILVISGYLQVQAESYTQVFEQPQVAREIGEIVKHSDKTVFLAYHYGLPLEYYGEFSGKYWPRSKTTGWLASDTAVPKRTVQGRLMDLDYIPEYFIITHFTEYATHHQDLKDYLINYCSVLVQTDQYLIYNSCQQ